MALALTPADMELLQKRIRAAFSGANPQQELRAFVQTKLGFDIFDELGGADTAIMVYASKIINKTDEDGTTDVLVRALYVERKGDPELREFVRRLLPDALPLVSEQEFEKERIRSALTGLELLRNDPNVAQSIDRVRFDLETTATSLVELAAYKGMHDALHELQLRLYRQLSEEIAKLPDPEAADTLRLHIQDLATVLSRAVAAAGSLTDEILAAPEKEWTDRLGQIRSRLAAAANTDDPKEAREAEMQLRQLLRTEPTRLNNNLVQTARRIPWKRVIQTLRAVTTALTEEDPSRQPLVDTQVALESLVADVLARVEEHHLWQQVESSFWDTEDALKRDDKDAAEQISLLWPLIADQVRKIREKTPGEWVSEVEHFANAFTTVCPIPATPPLDRRARSAFQRLVYCGRNRFYRVDQDLNAQCQEMLRLSEPLRKLVQK